MGDRTVHAAWSEEDLVRYDRAGKWYVEPRYEGKRRQVTLADAVKYALLVEGNPSGRVFLDRPGGGTFDARYRAAKGS